MHESMANHLILPLEALAAFASWAVFDRAVVRAVLAVDVCMGAVVYNTRQQNDE